MKRGFAVLLALAVVTALTVTAVIVGGSTTAVRAQTAAQENPASVVEDFLGRVARILGIDKEKVTDAAKQAEKELIDKAAAGGRLTQEQADKLKKRVDEGFWGRMLPFRLGAAKPAVALDRDVTIKTAAEVLGMTEEDIRSQLNQGKSLADIAKDKGVDVQKLIDARLAKAKTALDQMVKDGKLTQQQADEALKGLPDQIRKQVEAKGSRGPRPLAPHFPAIVREDFDALASFLGMTSPDLQAQLGEGKSLAEIGAAKGKTTQQLTDFLVDKAKARIQQGAQRAIEGLPEAMKRLVEAKPFAGPMFGFGGRGGMRGHLSPAPAPQSPGMFGLPPASLSAPSAASDMT